MQASEKRTACCKVLFERGSAATPLPRLSALFGPEGVEESVGELHVPESSASGLGEHGSTVQQHMRRAHGAVCPGAGSPAAHRLVPVHHGVRVLAGRPAPGARRVRALLQGHSFRRRLLVVRRTARLPAVPAQLPLHGRR